MRLIELCRPFFRYVASLKRATSRGARLDADSVRAEVKKILGQMRKATDDPELEDQIEMVVLPLIFFVDFVILESASDLAQEWEPLAYERNELAGDQKFFELLEETLADESDAAAERLVVYHTCLGLGFTGAHGEGLDARQTYASFLGAGESNLVRIRRKVYARVRKAMDIKAAEHLCPGAYEHVDRSNRIEDTGRRLVVMAIALAALVCALVVANFFLFRRTSAAMSTVLDRIRARSGAPVAGVQAEPGKPGPPR